MAKGKLLSKDNIKYKWWILSVLSGVKDPKEMRFELRKIIMRIQQKSLKCTLIQRKLTDLQHFVNTKLSSYPK